VILRLTAARAGRLGLTLKIRVNARWGWTKKVPSKGDFLVVVVSRSLRGATLRKSGESFVLIVVLGMTNRRTLIIRISIPNIAIRKNPSPIWMKFACQTPSESRDRDSASVARTGEIIVESFVVSLLRIKIEGVRIEPIFVVPVFVAYPQTIAQLLHGATPFFGPRGLTLTVRVNARWRRGNEAFAPPLPVRR
jgi:hypothetical protein